MSSRGSDCVVSVEWVDKRWTDRAGRIGVEGPVAEVGDENGSDMAGDHLSTIERCCVMVARRGKKTRSDGLQYYAMTDGNIPRRTPFHRLVQSESRPLKASQHTLPVIKRGKRW